MPTWNRGRQNLPLFARLHEKQIPCFIKNWQTLDDSAKVVLMKVRFQADADLN
jgi:hypothetical protein